MEKVNEVLKQRFVKSRQSEKFYEEQAKKAEKFYNLRIEEAETFDEKEELIKSKHTVIANNYQDAYAQSEIQRTIIMMYAEINEITQWNASCELRNYETNL